MDWTNRHVLITGAGGFIASHLVECLIAKMAKMRAFVRYNSRGDLGMLRMLPMEVLSQLEVVAGDLRDVDAVRKGMKLWMPNKEAKELIGWEPRVSRDEGLRRTIEWIPAHLNLYPPGQHVI